ncbi:MAG: phosphotransferase family protein [Pseudohongiella sp.]|nr:phosphotransferase family protein [Pseudohongiella sp.]MDP2128103.1 phosphotransferase family protein [Pseudohongiella sp.]
MNAQEGKAQLSALTAWISQHAPQLGSALSLQKFDAGQSNPSFLLKCDHRQLVLRRKPAGELLASAHAVDREFRLISALQNTPVPVPEAIALCEDNSVIGSMFYLMSYEPGDILWDPALPEIIRNRRADYYFSLVGTLAELHRVDYKACGLEDFGKPGNYYARQLARWSSQYEASATAVINEMDQLITWLADNTPADDGQSCIIHGDYRLDNVIFHRGESKIRAVLDWELATLGHPMADLAYYLMALRLPRTGEIKGLQNEDLATLGIPDEDSLIDHYCHVRGINRPAHTEFYLAFSFFRLAAILQGVYKRGLDGNASSERAIRMGKLVQPLAAMGLSVTRQAAGI